MYPLTINSPSEPIQPSDSYSVAPKSHGFDLLRVLRMHRTFAICAGAITSLLFAGVALTRHRQYKTESLIYVHPITAKVMTDASGGSYDANRYDSYIQQQLQTVVRPDILADALEQLPPGTWRGPQESQQSAVTRLQGALKVERLLGSYQVSISLAGNDPAAITKVVNAVTTVYLRKGRLDELAQSDQQLQLLTDERQRIQTELASDRQEQTELGTALGVADPGGMNANPFDAQLEDLRKQLSAARAARSFADAQLASVSGQGAMGSDAMKVAADDTTATDPGLAALKTSISQRRSVLTTQMAGLTPANPIYLQDQEELARLAQSMDSLTSDLRNKAVPQIQGKLRLDAARAADVEARLAAQLRQLTSAATSAAPKLQRASDLSNTIHRLETRFSDVDNAIRSIELEHSSSGLVHLSLAAVQPQKPEATKKQLILALAVPGGLLFAIAGAVLRHKFDPRVYIADDIRAALDFSPMAVLPHHKEVGSKVLDEFMLRLVAGVDQTHRVADARTYIFTAASPQTDTSHLVAALSKRMGRLGYRTTILKASDALEAAVPETERTVKAWGGASLARSTESRVVPMKRTSYVIENLEKLKQNIDILFIEAFPLLQSAETEFVVRLVDATVLVAESGSTTKKDLKNSIELLRRLSTPGVAVVLDGLNLRNADDDFIKTVKSVEGRHPSFWHSERTSQQHLRVTPEVSIYENIDPVSQNRNNSA